MREKLDDWRRTNLGCQWYLDEDGVEHTVAMALKKVRVKCKHEFMTRVHKGTNEMGRRWRLTCRKCGACRS